MSTSTIFLTEYNFLTLDIHVAKMIAVDVTSDGDYYDLFDLFIFI